MEQKHSSADGQDRNGHDRNEPALVPPVDIHEDATGITLHVDLPGVSKDRLAVRVDGDNLLIEGLSAVEMPGQMELHHAEIRNPCYRRSFTLSRELDTSKIDAVMKDGVLRLHVPKSEAAQPRRIQVSVG